MATAGCASATSAAFCDQGLQRKRFCETARRRGRECTFPHVRRTRPGRYQARELTEHRPGLYRAPASRTDSARCKTARAVSQGRSGHEPPRHRQAAGHAPTPRFCPGSRRGRGRRRACGRDLRWHRRLGTPPLYPEVVGLGYPPPPDLPPEFQGTALHDVCRDARGGHGAQRGPTSHRRPLRPSGRAALRLLRGGPPPTSSSWTPVDGRVVEQPGAGHDSGDPEDLGVVAIPDSIVPPGITPATLPAAGALATLRHGDLLTIVGVGCERLAQNGGPANLRCGDFRRRYTTAPFQALRPFTPGAQRQHGGGAQGGACFADSGAPVFKPDDAAPRAVLATTSGGNPLCNSVERFYRTDTPTARDFLTSQGIAVP